jgi:hypothetical protein
MANRISGRSDFDLSSALLDEHEWLTDSIIDDLGINCKIVYPPKDSECPNCIFDRDSNRSSSIYKNGGPISFDNFSVCPVCGGEGRLYTEQTEAVKLRVYWNRRDWVKTETTIVSPDGFVQIIGYMSDLIKLRKAKELILNSDLQDIQELKYSLTGELQPWGFRHNRYFVGYLQRV